MDCIFHRLLINNKRERQEIYGNGVVEMSGWFRKKRNAHQSGEPTEIIPESTASVDLASPLSAELEANLTTLKHIFQDCSELVCRYMEHGGKKSAALVYLDGLVKTDILEEHLLRPLLEEGQGGRLPSPGAMAASGVSLSQLAKTGTWKDTVRAIVGAQACLLVDGSPEASVLDVTGGMRRGIEEPTTESVVRGPREGFTEDVRVNMALVRFKIKSPSLKTIPFTIGRETRTTVVLSYMEGLADPGVVKEAKKRLAGIDIDGILESGYIEELIEDEPLSPFPQLQYTERPDTVAANLLEGRIAIFTDGTPFILLAPVTVWQLMQASEDYYERYLISTLLRWLRLLFIFVALFLPSLYIAVTTFHQDMLPSTLILSIAASREAIPFPAIVEALIMEISFEALREAGIRLPKTVGQTVSILGALVIGQAAVQAGIVSAPMVIVVSMTGIASFTIPRFNLAISIRLLRFPMMLLAAGFGIFGMIVGTMLLAAHMAHLRSFGVPYLSGVAPYEKGAGKDIFVRVPWWKLDQRPRFLSKSNRRRMKPGLMPSPPPEEGW